MTIIRRTMLGTPAPSAAPGALTYQVGFNFRRTLADATDAPEEFYVSKANATYPRDDSNSNGAWRFGFSDIVGGIDDSRIVGDDRRFSGFVYPATGTTGYLDFRVNLSSGTNYYIEAAFGRQSAASHSTVTFYDHTTVIAGIGFSGPRWVYLVQDVFGVEYGTNGVLSTAVPAWIAGSIETLDAAATTATIITLAQAGDGDGPNLRVRVARTTGDVGAFQHIGIWTL